MYCKLSSHHLINVISLARLLLLIELACARGEGGGDGDAERMFGDERRHATHVCAERVEQGSRIFILQLGAAGRLGGTSQSAPQTIKR